ncbi:hypothetical protein ACIP5Y_04580 [Nocardia sp. NPDC088792]|uniref:hypothetical protein n=1 Tax=Nocardia sp. NPDC088792 TaxID=3364332 RepID=UPI003825E97D
MSIRRPPRDNGRRYTTPTTWNRPGQILPTVVRRRPGAAPRRGIGSYRSCGSEAASIAAAAQENREIASTFGSLRGTGVLARVVARRVARAEELVRELGIRVLRSVGIGGGAAEPAPANEPRPSLPRPPHACRPVEPVRGPVGDRGIRSVE